MTGAITNDSIVSETLLDDIPKFRTPARGRRRRLPCAASVRLP
jgi:hypothetical protein